MGRAILAATLALLCVRGALSDQQQPQQHETEIQKAIDEFKIRTRNLGLRADSPRRKGASGLRPEWHGRLFENFRNDFLDAVPHEVRQVGGDKSTLRRNQFGFNVSGPVLIPRLYHGSGTYFSLSYEGVRENISRSYLRTIPTMLERTGNWSQSVDQAGELLPIYDPATTSPNPNYDPGQPVSTTNLQYLRDPFPGNRVPASRLDPVAQKALTYYPAPNAAVGPFFQNNFFIHAPETNVANGMIAKLDHTFRERHRVSLGLSFSNGLLGAAEYFPNAANPGPSDRNFYNRHGSLEHTFTISARTINAFTFEATTDGSTSSSGEPGNYAGDLGLNGPFSFGFPNFQFDYLGMGRSYPNSTNVRDTFVWTDSFSTRHGKHGFRMVGQYARYQVNTYWPQYPAGMFDFSAGLTSLPGIVNTGHPFASFLLGLSDFSELSVVQSPSYFRNSNFYLALRHSYEASPQLTFHVGVDIVANTPRTEKYNRQGTIDLNVVNPANGLPGAYVAAGRNGFGRAFEPTAFHLQPSASLSWNPRGNPKTVVRLSFSRSYGAYPVYFGQWGTQGFNGTPTFISPNVQLQPAVTLADGIPPLAQQFPDLRPDVANNTIADLMDMSGRQPVYQSASMSFERELPGSVVVTAGASYSGGRNLWVGDYAANPNAIPLSALQYRDQLNDETFNQSLRPYPQYKGFAVYSSYPRGRYQRDAGYLRLEKRASQGLTLRAYFEMAKQLDDYSGPYGTQDFFNRQNEWSLTPGSSPEYLSLTYVYELPMGPNRRFFTYSDWRRLVVGGWSVSGASSLYAGGPLALHPQFNNTGGVVSALHVNVVPGVDSAVAHPSPDLWFNPAAFDQPADFTLGDASRTDPKLRNPGSQSHDVSVTKRFALAADRTLEFSFMGLNFLNHANWNHPDTAIGPESAPNVNAGKIIGSRGGRVVQLGVRFSF